MARVNPLFTLLTMLLVGCDEQARGGAPAAGAPRCDPAKVVPENTVVVRLEEERIVPDTVHLQAGRAVELLVCNTGKHARELLIGRGQAGRDFAEPFFQGVTVTEMQGGVIAAEWPARSPESPLTAAPADAPHAHPHLAFLLQPEQSASLRFAPPAAKRGTWEMRSFRGQQYERSSRGIWIVE